MAIGFGALLPILAGGISGAISGTDRDPNRLCPGTPQIVDDIAWILERNPSLLSSIRARVNQVFAGEKDLAVAATIMGTARGVAQAAVWLAWGGADCKTGSKEPSFQMELTAIADQGRAQRGVIGGGTFPATVPEPGVATSVCSALPEPLRSQCFAAAAAGPAALSQFQSDVQSAANQSQIVQAGGITSDQFLLIAGGIALFLVLR